MPEPVRPLRGKSSAENTVGQIVLWVIVYLCNELFTTHRALRRVIDRQIHACAPSPSRSAQDPDAAPSIQ